MPRWPCLGLHDRPRIRVGDDQDSARSGLEALLGDTAPAQRRLRLAGAHHEQVCVVAPGDERHRGSSVDEERVDGGRQPRDECRDGLSLALDSVTARRDVAAGHVVDQWIVRIGPGRDQLQVPAAITGDLSGLPQGAKTRSRAVHTDDDPSGGCSGRVS